MYCFLFRKTTKTTNEAAKRTTEFAILSMFGSKLFARRSVPTFQLTLASDYNPVNLSDVSLVAYILDAVEQDCLKNRNPQFSHWDPGSRCHKRLTVISNVTQQTIVLGMNSTWEWKLDRAVVGIVSVIFLLSASCASHKPVETAHQYKTKFCQPNQSCWPTPAVWRSFGTKLSGKLEMPESPLLPCRIDAKSESCATALKNLNNPYFVEDHPGGTQSTGWLGAWSASASNYAVAAESTNDIAEAVKFARQQKLKLVIKGTGHDYLGRSNAPDSLLVWIHKMRKVQTHTGFAPMGCSSSHEKLPAVSVEAGTRWLEAYKEVTVKQGRYVQGGGGGTFGIVSKATMRTYPIPKYFGWLNGSITAKSDDAFRELLERFVAFYRENLSNEHWGEQIKITGGNKLELSLAFQGMSAKEAENVWRPFQNWVDANAEKFIRETRYIAIPGRKMWDYTFIRKNFASAIENDKRSGQPEDNYWWDDDAGQVSIYWYAYQSRWIPLSHFDPANSKRLAETLFQASRHWPIRLHFNKGQAGASAEAVRLGRETSINPELYNAAVLVIAGAGGEGFPGVQGREPKEAEGEKQRTRVSAAMKLIRDATPGAGTYSNEADYFEPDWQSEFWGTNYSRLLEIKKKYDPDSIFVCHHCIGSEL